MSKSFEELPKEKKNRIINAGLEVFSKNDYKHAATDDIAAKSKISKGLLFYYFHNKLELYNYLLDHVIEVTEKYVLGEEFSHITDFFELIEYAAQKKAKIIEKMPFLLDFVMKAYFADGMDKNKLAKLMEPTVQNELAVKYFKNIDLTRFKNPNDVYTVLQMFTWMSEGYLMEKKREGAHYDINEFIAKCKEWSEMFKKMYYKEEWQ